MENVFEIIFVALVVWFIFNSLKKLIYFKSKNDDTETHELNKVDSIPVQTLHIPYRKKQYFLTNNERNFLYMLEQVVNNKYYIFPQVHYSKILYADGQQNFHNPDFNKIDRKSADFVLFNKDNISPVLVIEVDDSSHNRLDRVERDEFVNSILEKCEIPILRVKPFIDKEKLNECIIDKLNHGCNTLS